MSNKHEPDIPAGLDAFVNRLDDLQSVFGSAIVPTLAAVKEKLLFAMAARDRGDRAATFAQLNEAMALLTRFADQLDPHEAAAMRAVAQMFQTALARGDQSEAKRSAAVMFEKSGARERKPD